MCSRVEARPLVCVIVELGMSRMPHLIPYLTPHHARAYAAFAALSLIFAASGPAFAVPPPRIDGFCVDPIPPEQELCCAELPVPDAETVTVDTPLGAIVIELYSNVTPETVANFRGYIDRGDYTDTIVHRTVPADPPLQPDDFVIQAGGYRLSGSTFDSIERQDPVMNEPCLSNVLGTVAMARASGEVSSGTSEWFVNLADSTDSNTFLDTVDEGFTVFGRVIEGMDVIKKVEALGSRSGRTSRTIEIADCGELKK